MPSPPSSAAGRRLPGDARGCPLIGWVESGYAVTLGAAMLRVAQIRAPRSTTMKFTRPLVAGALLAAVALPSFAAQPHMEAALNSLNQALAELKQASSDKGGNR